MVDSVDKYNPEQYSRLVAEQHANFPPLAVPSEYSELFQVNTLQLLVKLARYKFVARLLKRTDDLLEVGSGSGLGTIFLSQHVKHVTGLEINKHDFDAACSVNKRENVTLRNQSIFDYAAERKHDAALAMDVIEHFEVEGGRKLVAQMARQCAPQGVVFIGTPSIHSYPYQSKYSQAAHIKCYDQAELVALMDEFFIRTFAFSMNDEVVHTGHPKLAWYYFVIGVVPRAN
jgi:2-polyprenyl-3-methyl-5-hydroxy-6-metoxy-1,4-benzoquinol methylase